MNKKTTEIDKAIASNIKHYRISSGLKLKEIAKKLGVTHQQFAKYETAANRISAGRLYEVAQILSVSITRLYDTKDSDRPTLGRGSLRFFENYSRLSFEKRKAINTIAEVMMEGETENEYERY